MAKPLPQDQELAQCGTELEVLTGVIDYAEKMITQDGLRSPYAALRRHAYGKTVVIESEKEGQLVFRLSSTPVLYPNFSSGYATPHSPIGRLCSFLRPGDEDETPKWGWYRVVETRLFDRFDGLVFEDNVRNFLRMTVDGENGHAVITDVRRTLRRRSMVVAPHPTPTSVTPAPVEETMAAGQEEVPASVVLPGLQLAHLEVADDDTNVEETTEYDDGEDFPDGADASTEGYFGLSEIFYVNRTREQDQIIARSPVGAMFVEGVAGSGKTSAALGRTKMLCDFNESSVMEEREFRDIAGQALTHWSGKFAGKFSQEGSIGFVRTGELIQYLKETCRRIELPHLPVAEFKELQVRLRQHRKIERSRHPGWRWSMTANPRGTETDTTMAWLFAADRAIAVVFSEFLTSALPNRSAITDLFIAEQRPKIEKIVDVSLQVIQEIVNPIQTALRRPAPKGRFALDRLADTLARAIQDLRSKVLGKEVLWILDGDQTLYAANEYALASLLVQRKVPLFLRNSARLVVLNDQGPVDKSLIFLSLDGERLEWNAQTAELLAAGQVAVQDASGQAFPATSADAKTLALKILPEALDRLYVLRGGKLRPLAIQRGLGRLKFELIKPQVEVLEDDTELDDSEDVANPAVAATATRFKTIDATLRQLLQKALLHELVYLADLYKEALETSAEEFPDLSLARTIHTQLCEKKLAAEDIDLLLCLAHLVGRGFEGSPAPLKTPAYYQCVFIDEVQDFTEQQIYLMAEQAKPDYKAVTAVGDIAQKLHHGSQIDIRACFPGMTVAHVQLTENLRQLNEPGLAWFSACFRAIFQDGLVGSQPTGELLKRLTDNAGHVRGPEFESYDDLAESDDLVIKLLRRVPTSQTAAVILPDSDTAASTHQRLRSALAAAFIETELSEKVDLSRRHVRHFTSVTHAKGLEFDVVLVPYLESYDLEDRAQVNRLYVALTRARKRLILLSANDRETTKFDTVWREYEDAIARL
jgi:formate dehydrogenase maturation protein FdhE